MKKISSVPFGNNVGGVDEFAFTVPVKSCVTVGSEPDEAVKVMVIDGSTIPGCQVAE